RAERIPDLNDEVGIALVRRNDDARCDRDLVAQRQRHLTELVIEQRRGLVEDAPIREQSGERGNDHYEHEEPNEQAKAQRGHGTKYPTPRSVLIVSAPSFRRSECTYTSIALLSIVSSHP